MAKAAGQTKPPKPTRAEKKAARAQRRESRRETWRNMRQAFTLTRQNDPRFLPYVVIAGVLAGTVTFLIVFLLSSWLFAVPMGVLAALVAAMLVFSRRAQKSMYAQAEDQAGAAGWLLSQQLKGEWRLEQGVAGTTQLDVVHRLVGRPGVVLVGEGAPQRVRPLLAQEKKKVARICRDAEPPIPIYDIVVGKGEDEVRLGKLQRHLLKLPPNLSKEQVAALDKRLKALGAARTPLPQGPMPPGAKMRNVQRAARRRT